MSATLPVDQDYELWNITLVINAVYFLSFQTAHIAALYDLRTVTDILSVSQKHK